ncbi:MAG: LysM peptidoglycan-binding domain-containing protein [Phycisphaerales bacterium]|jgi:nucleoid-associated protein YgaU|nr:LysM peptidoglycan-binding domain-containing protein [Phycisphaerales bacterium]
MSTGGKFILLAAAAAIVILIVVYGGGPTAIEASPPVAVPQQASVQHAAAEPSPAAPSQSVEPGAPLGRVAEQPLTPAPAPNAGGPGVVHEAIIEMGVDLSPGITEMLGLSAAARQEPTPPQIETAAGPAPTAGGSRPSTVVVQGGDTLIAIARRSLGDEHAWERLVDANPGINPRALRVGMVLQLPREAAAASPAGSGSTATGSRAAGSRRHVIASGDSLSSISQTYYGDAQRWYSLFEANREALRGEPDRLVVGTELVIP